MLDGFTQPVSLLSDWPVRFSTTTEPYQSSIELEGEVADDVVRLGFFPVEVVISNLEVRESGCIPFEKEEQCEY